MGYFDNDWLSCQDKEQNEKIKKLNIEIGDWVQLKSEYGDVWHEVKNVFKPDDYFHSVVAYIEEGSKSTNVKTEIIYFNRIRTAVKNLPKDSRCVFCVKGAFSERRGNLSDVFSLLNV